MFCNWLVSENLGYHRIQEVIRICQLFQNFVTYEKKSCAAKRLNNQLAWQDSLLVKNTDLTGFWQAVILSCFIFNPYSGKRLISLYYLKNVPREKDFASGLPSVRRKWKRFTSALIS